MSQEFESVELEYSDEDILYYIEDEEGNEVGFGIMEDGKEIEYFYEGYDADDFEEAAAGAGVGADDADSADGAGGAEVVEMEVDEDAILYYLVDEDDNEIGFVIEEDGQEVECYYEEEPAGTQPASAPAAAAEPEEAKEPGYLQKMASIAGFHGNKARKKAEVEIDKVRGVAEKQVDKATVAVEAGGKKLRAKKEETDLGITREDVSQATADLNVIAKEGAATMKELKGTYDDIMDSFGFLVPKKVKRKLP